MIQLLLLEIVETNARRRAEKLCCRVSGGFTRSCKCTSLGRRTSGGKMCAVAGQQHCSQIFKGLYVVCRSSVEPSGLRMPLQGCPADGEPIVGSRSPRGTCDGPQGRFSETYTSSSHEVFQCFRADSPKYSIQLNDWRPHSSFVLIEPQTSYATACVREPIFLSLVGRGDMPGPFTLVRPLVTWRCRRRVGFFQGPAWFSLAC